MSLQRLAIISAVSSHGMMRNRTVYYERQQNDTNIDRGINFQQHFNVFIGGAFLSFAITLLCVVCYCFNRIINKNSMALYRRHLMEATNNQNLDIYTVEQFYETEAYAPLCEAQAAQNVLPPSYDDVMAAEKAILNKYAKICTATKCCEHSELHRSNGQQSPIDSGTIGDGTAEQPAHECDDKTLENNRPANSATHDDNGNEIATSQTSSPTCCESNQAHNSTCCRVQIECSCVDNCSVHNINENASENTHAEDNANENANPSTQDDEGDNTCSNSGDESSSTDTNNNVAITGDMVASQCECGHRRRGNSPVEFDVLSDNGIVRMDMSKIIDRTGLPTYDAAIKLESFGYV